MTETDSYASRKCTVGEAERFCNFGSWDEADYGNCCKCFYVILTSSQLQARM